MRGEPSKPDVRGLISPLLRMAREYTPTMRCLVLIACACTSTAPGSDEPKPAKEPVVAAIPRDAATVVRHTCQDVAAEIASRAPGAKPVDAADQFDLDGDGVNDSMFRGYCTSMGGNCEYHLFASADGCARYVGTVQATRVASAPRCADSPRNRTPCRITATRMMIHGELYEYFYAYGANGYAEAGVGHKGERPSKRGP